MALDANVLQARYNGGASSIYINYYGGYTALGPYGIVGISESGTMTTGLVGINGNYNGFYALNVNANSSYNGINITDGGNAYALTAVKSGLLTGISVQKTSTTSYDACILGVSSGTSTGIQGSSATGIGVYGTTGNSGNYAGFFSGGVYTNGSYVASDISLKKDIREFNKAMDIINRLQPKLYQYKDDEKYKTMNLPKGDRYGLIAQNVEKILPGLVKQTKFEVSGDEARINGNAKPAIDFKALNYTELIPILIKGMQEQQIVIDKQQQQIDELKSEVEKLSGNSSAKPAQEINTAYLRQNIPNPFTQNTVININIPDHVQQAQLMIYDTQGNQVRSFPLKNKGINTITISAGSLAAGQYVYTLIADGKIIDSKKLTLAK